MIIDTSQGDIEIVGDIKEFKTSIDPKNLEFITTLLSSNLYSDPEQSFIREIVSNAWDSHVEAGTTDVPVIVKFTDSCGDKSVTIRDFGVGLSPERFQEVYCNIGSSTKRESNEFIGGFGIGKYSSLACSNTVYITSYYEGIAYYYLMVKSGNTITTNLLMEKPTTEKNGVEVTIKNIPDLTPYDKALQYITFFPNVYIDGAPDADKINTAKLKRFKHFAAASINIPSKLLLGNVLYPVQAYHLNIDARRFLEHIAGTGIVIKFDVGEINITPNRENIIYSSDTIKKIEDRIKDAKDELDSLVDSKIAKDYDDILDYYDAVDGTIRYDPVTHSITNADYGGYRVTPSKMSKTSITYNGIDLRPCFTELSIVSRVALPNFKGLIYDDKIYTKKMPWRMYNYDKIFAHKVIVLNAGARMTPCVKCYLREKYNSYSVITDITESDFKEWIKGAIASYTSLPVQFDLMVEGAYKSLMKRAIRLDLNSDPDFLKFKDNLAANKSIDVKDVRESILYVWDDGYWYRRKREFKRFSSAVEFIKGLKKGIILSNMDGDESLLVELAKLKGFALIKARKDIVSELRAMNLKCIVDIDWLLYKDPMLSVVNTIDTYFPAGIDEDTVKELYFNIDKELWHEFHRLSIIDRKYRINAYYKTCYKRDSIQIDPYTAYLCTRLKDYITKHKDAKKIVTDSGLSQTTIMTTAVVIKTKAYRVSGEAYNRIKNNKLINILCRK